MVSTRGVDGGSPRASLWLGLVTPVYARVGRELIAGLKNRSIVTDPAALAVFSIRPAGLRDAIGRALRYEDRAFALTRWSDARSSAGAAALPADARFGGKLVDARKVEVPVDADRAFLPIARIGGGRGWYFGTSLWRIRGAIDLLMGGVGLRRGRRDPEVPAVGDTLDFWRVEAYEPGRRLRLAAEMKVPGRAWLEFEVVPGPPRAHDVFAHAGVRSHASRAEPEEDETRLPRLHSAHPGVLPLVSARAALTAARSPRPVSDPQSCAPRVRAGRTALRLAGLPALKKIPPDFTTRTRPSHSGN